MMSPFCVETLTFRKLFHTILVFSSNAFSTFALSEGNVIVGRWWYTLEILAMPAQMVIHTSNGTFSALRDWYMVSIDILRICLICLCLQL